MSVDEQRIRSVENAVVEIKQAVSSMENSVAKIAEAMTAIALMEQRQFETRESLGRAFDRIETLENDQGQNMVRFENISGRFKPLEESRGWMLTGFGLLLLGVVGAWLKLIKL